jgi:nucleoside-diphosphate-sugar epimerase
MLEQNIPVLCEKPLTEEALETKQLVELASQQRVPLLVNQTRRFFPTYQKIRELITEGVLGELTSVIYHDGVEFDWPAASPHHFAVGAKGAWSDTGVHLLDSICYWLNAEPELVSSENDSRGGPEAMATVRLKHRDCKIEIKVSRLGRLRNGFEIIGTRGKIVTDSENWYEVRVENPQGRSQTYRCGSRKSKYTDFARPMLENFLTVIDGHATPMASGASVLGTIRLLDQAYREARPYHTPWNDAIELTGIDLASSLGKSSPKVLVTGASGFVGGRLVEAMQLASIATPVAVIRKWSRASRIACAPTEIRIGDILSLDDSIRLTEGVDAIIHCAKTDDRESIVGGTRNLLEAAEHRGVKRFVFLSTAEVYGPHVRGSVDEQAATPLLGRLYGDCKIEAEELCRSFVQRGVETTILRPSIIYGPYSTSWSVDIAKRLLSGKWGQFEDLGEGIANLIYIDDLVQAILRSLSSPNAIGKTFNVVGPDRVTWNQYFARFNESLGRQPLAKISATRSRLKTRVMGGIGKVTGTIVDRFKDPLMEIYLQGGIASKIMKRVKGELQATPSVGELHDLFSRQAIYCDRAAREQLGFEPKFDLQRGLSLTTAWLRLHEIVTSCAREPSETDRSGNGPREPSLQELAS